MGLSGFRFVCFFSYPAPGTYHAFFLAAICTDGHDTATSHPRHFFLDEETSVHVRLAVTVQPGIKRLCSNRPLLTICCSHCRRMFRKASQSFTVRHPPSGHDMMDHSRLGQNACASIPSGVHHHRSMNLRARGKVRNVMTYNVYCTPADQLGGGGTRTVAYSCFKSVKFVHDCVNGFLFWHGYFEVYVFFCSADSMYFTHGYIDVERLCTALQWRSRRISASLPNEYSQIAACVQHYLHRCLFSFGRACIADGRRDFARRSVRSAFLRFLSHNHAQA